mgnify:CR=1 FL=1
MSKDIKIGDVIEKVRSYHPAADVEVIRKERKPRRVQDEEPEEG